MPTLALLSLIAALLAPACGRDPDLYAACEEADDCAELVPEDAEGTCLDKGDEGFCTWACTADADCSGDGDEDRDFVCASFEDETGLWCFPSCEGVEDEEDACPDGMTCRSTGGGSDNRKICFPDELDTAG